MIYSHNANQFKRKVIPTFKVAHYTLKLFVKSLEGIPDYEGQDDAQGKEMCNLGKGRTLDFPKKFSKYEQKLHADLRFTSLIL